MCRFALKRLLLTMWLSRERESVLTSGVVVKRCSTVPASTHTHWFFDVRLDIVSRAI